MNADDVFRSIEMWRQGYESGEDLKSADYWKLVKLIGQLEEEHSGEKEDQR